MRIQGRAHGYDVLAHGPDQFAARDDGAAHDIAVSGGVFRQAVQKDVDVVGAMVVKAREGIIEHGEGAGAARMAGQMADIGDLRHRIGGAFEHHQPGRPIAQHALDALEILDGQQRVGDPVLREKMLHDVARRPIGLDEGEDVIALLAQRQEARGDGRDPPTPSEGNRPGPAAVRAAAAAASRWGWRCASRRTLPCRRAGGAASRRCRRMRISRIGRSAPPADDCPPAPGPREGGSPACSCSWAHHSRAAPRAQGAR